MGMCEACPEIFFQQNSDRVRSRCAPALQAARLQVNSTAKAVPLRRASMSSTERPSKQQAFLALLREGWTSLHIDARRPGVIVPTSFRREAHLVLQYGHDLPIPIPDLEVDEYGVRATLSFSRPPI